MARGDYGKNEAGKKCEEEINKGSKMIIHTKSRYSIFSKVPLILLFLLPAVSLAGADSIIQKPGMYNEEIESYKQATGDNG